MLGANIHDTPLNRLVIPGSHDAGTYGFTTASPMSPDRTDLPAPARLFRCITSRFSKAQSFSLGKQCEAGARYFDLRAVPVGQKKYAFTHGQAEGDFLAGVYEILSFAHAHPQEIVILDITQLPLFSDDDHTYVTAQIKSMAGDRLASRAQFNGTSTVGAFWEQQKNVIVIYHASVDDDDFWTSYMIRSTYANLSATNDVLDHIDSWISTNPPNARLSIAHCTRTPDRNYILTHLGGSLRAMTDEFTPPLRRRLEGWKDQLNIVLVNFVDTAMVRDITVLNVP